MIYSELYRITKSYKGKAIILLILTMQIVDILINFLGNVYDYTNIPSSELYHPAYAAFLSSSSQGHICQILLFWILPLYFLIAYSDSAVTDYNTKYSNCVISRIGSRKYYFSKISTAFIFPFFITFISLVINFIICFLIFRNGQSFANLESYVNNLSYLFKICIQHPYISYFIYICIFSLISGFTGILGVCVSSITRNYFITYPLIFFLWLLQIASKYSITYTFQPFIEYGFKYFIIGFIRCFFITTISVILLYVKRIQKDEI